MNKDPELLFNVILFGESTVGKTTLIMRYAYFFNLSYDKNVFSTQHFTTLGSEFILKKLSVNDQEVTLKIWDTAGQERFMTITRSFYRQANGVMLVYDVTKKDSLNKLEAWIESINENAHSNVVKYLIANKTDLVEDRVISTEKGNAYAEKHEMKYFETSAKDKLNVNEIFDSITRDLLESSSEGPNQSVLLKKPGASESKGFCC